MDERTGVMNQASQSNLETKRIGLFGGAFDPPHLGHLTAITLLLNSAQVDEVWLVPVGDDRGDKPPAAPAVARGKMVELMLQESFPGCRQVRLNTVQLEGKLPGSFTIDLWDRMRSDYPRCEFYFVTGADNLKFLSAWKSPERLLNEVHWLVVNRPGETIECSAPKHFRLVKNAFNLGVNLSSSQLRAMLRKGERVAGLLPLSVAAYIRTTGLYC